MQINAPINKISAARARFLMGTAAAEDLTDLKAGSTNHTALLVAKDTTLQVNNAISEKNAAPADKWPIAPAGGYIAGDHLRAGSVIIHESVRDDTVQEVGVFLEMIAKTGEGTGGDHLINNGKTCLAFGVEGRRGGGQVWGAAGGVNVRPGWNGGFAAAIEIDTNNNAGNAGLGSGFANVTGIFQNSISHYRSTAAHWVTGVCNVPTAGAVYDLGTFYQEGTTPLIGHSTFHDDTNSPRAFYANSGRTHSVGTFVDKANGLVGMEIGGNKTAAAILTNASAPIGIAVQGVNSAAGIQINDQSNVAIDITGSHAGVGVRTSDANVPTAIQIGTGQKFRFGPFSMYCSSVGKVVFKNEATGEVLMAMDGFGNAVFKGNVSSGTPTET